MNEIKIMEDNTENNITQKPRIGDQAHDFTIKTLQEMEDRLGMIL